ncbi:MAG: Spy/CpxP family protein refolding chaperone [Mastigocoleus sp.]
MNFKKLVPAAIITISTMGFVVPSVIAITAEASQAQVTPGRSANGGERKSRKFKALNLTEEQKSQLREIRQSYREKMGTILTSEQKALLNAAKEQGQNRRQVMRSLNLTEGQKQELRELKKSQREEISNILTEEQKQKMQELRQQRQSRRGRNRRSQ